MKIWKDIVLWRGGESLLLVATRCETDTISGGGRRGEFSQVMFVFCSDRRIIRGLHLRGPPRMRSTLIKIPFREEAPL